jgi:hypothetical protein
MHVNDKIGKFKLSEIDLNSMADQRNLFFCKGILMSNYRNYKRWGNYKNIEGRI